MPNYACKNRDKNSEKTNTKNKNTNLSNEHQHHENPIPNTSTLRLANPKPRTSSSCSNIPNHKKQNDTHGLPEQQTKYGTRDAYTNAQISTMQSQHTISPADLIRLKSQERQRPSHCDPTHDTRVSQQKKTQTGHLFFTCATPNIQTAASYSETKSATAKRRSGILTSHATIYSHERQPLQHLSSTRNLAPFFNQDSPSLNIPRQNRCVPLKPVTLLTLSLTQIRAMHQSAIAAKRALPLHLCDVL